MNKARTSSRPPSSPSASNRRPPSASSKPSRRCPGRSPPRTSRLISPPCAAPTSAPRSTSPTPASPSSTTTSTPTQAVETTKYLQQLFAGRVTVIALSGSQESRPPAPGHARRLQRISAQALRTRSTRRDARSPRSSNTANTSNKPIAAGSILSFFGAKGGVGTTTLAVHLAMYLVQCHAKKRTLLIDHHAELGHVCVYLGIDGSRYHYSRSRPQCQPPGQRAAERLHRQASQRPRSALVARYLRRHPSTSIPTPSPRHSSSCAASTTTSSSIAQPRSTTPLSPSSKLRLDVYLVATPEIGAIRDLSRYVDNLMQIEGTTAKMQVVINRFSSRYAVNVEQIEKAIRLPVAIRLPNSYAELVRSVNLGEPISPQDKIGVHYAVHEVG